MSNIFTAVADWPKGGQDLAGANEIVLAYSERRQLGYPWTPVSLLSSGDNAQSKTLWNEMQTWLESSCTTFIDHINGPLTPAHDDYLSFSLETWRTAAGLSPNGFRRKANIEDDYSYGPIQTGDIRGFWCFEDFQKGLSALKWKRPGTGTGSIGMAVNQEKRTEKAEGFITCEDTIAGSIAAWPSVPWVSHSETYLYRAYAYLFNTAIKKGQYNVQRYAGSAFLNKIPTYIPHTADLYLRAYKPGSPAVFEDMDSLGFIRNEFVLYQTFLEDTIDNRVSDVIGKLDSNPIEISVNIGCPYASPNETGIYVMREEQYGVHWIIKWNFTNSN